MNSFTLLCSDLDGTLLDDRRQISLYSRRVIARAGEEGALFCLASGRSPAMAQAYHAQLGLRTPMVCNNGAIVWNPCTGEVLSRSPIPAAPALEFIRFCGETGLDWAMFTEEAVYFPESPARLERYGEYNRLAAAVRVPPMDLRIIDTLEQAAEALDRGGLRISVIFRTGREGELLAQYFSCHHELVVVHSTHESYDILAPGVNKWSGIQAVCRHYGITPQRVCVFGNDLNDAEMVAQAWTSFVVSNAERSLFPMATYRIESNQQDGVARAIERYVLGRIQPPAALESPTEQRRGTYE